MSHTLLFWAAFVLTRPLGATLGDLLTKAHRAVSALVKPIVHLAFIFDKIEGRLVGALEIDGCDDGPDAYKQAS